MHSKTIFVLFTIIATFFGCSNKTAEEYLAEAKLSIEQQDSSRATVLLKNALQKEPENAETRFLLGSLYNNSGAAELAEKELNLAYKFGYDVNDVLPLLARSLILQFKNQDLVELVDKVYTNRELTDEVITSLLAYQAQSYVYLDQPNKARESIEKANEIAADSMFTRLGGAFLKLNDNKFEEAISAVDQLLVAEPNFADALFLKGQLAYRTNDYADAVLSFEKYHVLQPEVIHGRVLLADSYIRNDKHEKARKHVNYLLRVRQNQPFINQLSSQIAYASDNFTDAKAAAEKAIQFGGDNNVTRGIAGVSSYRLGLEEQAYQHLITLENELPESHRLLSLLSLIKLNLGYDEDLQDIDSLSNLQETNLNALLNSAGQLVKQGRFSEVKKVVEAIDSSKVSDPLELTKLSMLKLGLQDKSAISDLEKVLASNPEANMAKAVLARAYLTEGRHEEAIKLAKSTITSNPENAEGYNLTGFLLDKIGRNQEAAEYFEQALSIDPNNSQTYLMLGQQAIGRKDWEEAKKQYSTLLKLRPVHLPGLNTFYKLHKLYGDPQLALAKAQEIYNENPNDNRYALIYAKILESEWQFEQAESVLKNITPEDLLPDAFWELNSTLLLRLNDEEQALQKITEWTRFKPESELAWRTLAAFHESQGDITEASNQVKNGLSLAKGNKDNLLVLDAQYSMMLDDINDAETIVKELDKKYEKSPVVSLLMGQLKMKEGNYEEAIDLLKVNYEFRPSSRVLRNLLTSYMKLGQKEQAISLAKTHLESHDGDSAAKLLLANLLQTNSPDEAIRLYEEVLQSQQNNVVALNNIAWLYINKGDSQKAVDAALLATKSAPASPAVFDTYGDALTIAGKNSEAVEAFSQAYVLSDKDSKYAQKYADALKSNNQHQLAEKVTLEANL